MHFQGIDSFMLTTDLSIIIHQYGELKQILWKDIIRFNPFAHRQDQPGTFIGIIGKDGSYMYYNANSLIEHKFITCLPALWYDE